MDPILREEFNQSFSESTYQQYITAISKRLRYPQDFRISETPVFLTDDFSQTLQNACRSIIDQLNTDAFNQHTASSIPDGLSVPGESDHPHFLQIDFAITHSGDEFIPQLIELQGFPSVYGFQYFLTEQLNHYFPLTRSLTPYFNDLNTDSYAALLRATILGSQDPEQTVLLEIEPHRQKTRIDFAATEALTGINTVCLSEIISEGKNLFYKNESGQRIKIERIYNRVILDELMRKPIPMNFSFFDDLNVEWAGHPNWFFKISKHTLPFLKGPYVPECYFLDQIDNYPDDLENFVLKPLYSFAGLGVDVEVTNEKLNKIQPKENYILQRKIEYAPFVKTPDGFSKVEIRMMYLWNEEPLLVNNLVRMSKGKMMGVDFNKEKTWVGSSAALHR